MLIRSSCFEKVLDLLKKAKKAGADSADAIYIEGTSLSIACRKGQKESLARAEGTDIGLRVFLGRKQAIVSSSDFTDEALTNLVDRAVSMVKVVPEDEFCGLVSEENLASDLPEIESFDRVEPSAELLGERALCAEEAALNVAGVSNSEGAEASWGRSFVALAASNGFMSSRESSNHSLSVSVLAGEGTAMERDYDYAVSVFGEDLEKPTELGKSAGKKAVARLNPQKVETTKVLVIFDPRVSNSLVSHFSSAINGAKVARGTTFLKDKMNCEIFPKEVTICDDPLRSRGLRSKTFDAEGILTKKEKSC